MFASIAVSIAFCLKSSAADQMEDISVPIDQILSAIQTALTDTQVILYSKKIPPLKNVSLELQTTFSESGNSGLSLYVISASGKLSSENTKKVVLSLAPPPPEQISPAASPKVISQFLRDSLVQTAQGVQAAAFRKPPLVIKDLKAEIEFVVEKEGSADVGWKFVIVPIEVKAAGTLSTGSVQRITVDFGY